jgi:hypothetical protein
MPNPHRSLLSPLLGSFGLLLLVGFPLAAQEMTPAQRRAEAFLAQLPQDLARKFETVVMPKLLQAGSDDRVFDEAETNYIAWIRMVELRGIEVDASSLELAREARGRAYRTAILARGRYCFEQKDPSEVAIMQGLWSSAETQGLRTDLTRAMFDELISKCVRFELIFTSDIREESEGGTQRSVVKATVPLALETESEEGTLPVLRGSGPIEYVSFDLKMRIPIRCPIITSTQSAEATVHRLKYKIKRDSVKAPATYDSLELWLEPGRPTETIDVCGTPDTKSRWLTFFQILHHFQKTEEPGKAYFIFKKGWKVPGTGRIFATMDVPEPSSAAAPAGQLLNMLDGNMRLELHHKPVRP